jgi:hypothetical protein
MTSPLPEKSILDMADTLAEVSENDLTASEASVDITADPEDWNTEHRPAQAVNSESLDLTSLQAPLEAAVNDPHDHDHDQEGAEIFLSYRSILTRC